MRALWVFVCIFAVSAQAVMASDPPNPLSEEERARMRIVDVKAFFWHDQVPKSLAPMAQRLERMLRREFKSKMADGGKDGSAAGGNIHRVRLLAPITGFQLIEGGSASTLRGFVFIQDLETETLLARYGKISALQRFVGSRNTRIFLARKFAEEAFDLYNAESNLEGVRTVEEMGAAFKVRSATEH